VNIQLNTVACAAYPENSYETCCCTVRTTLCCNCHTVHRNWAIWGCFML